MPRISGRSLVYFQFKAFYARCDGVVEASSALEPVVDGGSIVYAFELVRGAGVYGRFAPVRAGPLDPLSPKVPPKLPVKSPLAYFSSNPKKFKGKTMKILLIKYSL